MSASWDLAGALGVALLAGLAYATMSGGSPLRVALALAVLFFIPGYLLIEAVARPDVPAHRRAARACVALGVSPAVVGLLALATALLPGGFSSRSIVALVTLACLALAALAFWRRNRAGRKAPTATTPSMA